LSAKDWLRIQITSRLFVRVVNIESVAAMLPMVRQCDTRGSILTQVLENQQYSFSITGNCDSTTDIKQPLAEEYYEHSPANESGVNSYLPGVNIVSPFKARGLTKSWPTQRHDEGTALKRIFAEQTKLRQAASTGGANPQLTETFREAVKDLPEERHDLETATKVAQAIGLGRGKQYTSGLGANLRQDQKGTLDSPDGFYYYCTDCYPNGGVS